MPSLKQMAEEAKKAKQSQRSEPAKKSASKSLGAKKLFSTEKVAESDLESETESEDDSESEEETNPAPVDTIPQANGHKAKVAALTNKSDSDDTSSGSESSSEGTSSSEDESSGSEDEALPVRPAKKSVTTIRKSASPLPIPAKTVQTATFVPPKGFESLSATKHGKTKAFEFFSSSNLAGKQLWYITAPASIPISQIKKVSLQDIQSGKSAISIDGTDYGFVKDKSGEQSTSKIMLPEESGKHYRLGKRPIDQTLHLQQIVKIPGSGPGPSKATIPQKKPVRQQPSGLKMRFRPIGFGSGSLSAIGSSSQSSDESDSSVEDDQRQFKAPPKVLSSGSSSTTSESDEEMVDAQEYIKADITPNTKVAAQTSKDKSETSSTSESDSSDSSSESDEAPEPPKPSLKRKLDETHTSSSSLNPPITDEPKLKKMKTKASRAQTDIAKLSRSIETQVKAPHTQAASHEISMPNPRATTIMPPPKRAPAPSSSASKLWSISTGSARVSETPVPPPRRLSAARKEEISSPLTDDKKSSKKSKEKRKSSVQVEPRSQEGHQRINASGNINVERPLGNSSDALLGPPVEDIRDSKQKKHQGEYEEHEREKDGSTIGEGPMNHGRMDRAASKAEHKVKKKTKEVTSIPTTRREDLPLSTKHSANSSALKETPVPPPKLRKSSSR